ncbi:MAG: DUF1573 domain-containing protein [Candidatus Omnitrophica bacterium]|nr:DUF1573 domain-containing protein [Candidatus Omnitrophota bacterium]
MKAWVLSLAMIVYLPVGAWCAASAPPDSQAPHAVEAVTDPFSWDFGSAKAGDVLEHEFVLVNKGTKDLAVKDTTTSCGCTVSAIGKKHLKPGESAALSVRFDTKGYSGDTKQFVYVNTDDLDEPVIRFTVRARIVQTPAKQEGAR